MMATSENSDKYDRQLRLWGGNGQRALMQAKVLLVNADAAGTETLKNLVLPGVGQFEILDNNLITPVDISNNFFVTSDDEGKPRAAVATELLVEMNPDVTGTFRLDGVGALLESDPQYFTAFSVIIASNVTPDVTISLSNLCDTHHIPLISLQSMGFIATCRIQTRDHEIIESHPDNELVDLGLTTSFPELETHCDAISLSLSNMNSMDRSHVPFVVLLRLALRKWKEEHEGNIPSTSAEKESFKHAYVKPLGGREDDGNIEEAVREAYRAFSKGDLSTVPADVVQLVEDQKGRVLNAQSSTFSWCVRALECYIELHRPRPVVRSESTSSVFMAVEQEQAAVSSLSLSEGRKPVWSPTLLALIQSRHEAAASRGGWVCSPVPLSGLVPDMHSSTAGFIEIQQIYAARAAGDKEVFSLILRELMSGSGSSGGSGDENPVPAVSTDTIDEFCKNIYHLRTLSTSKLSEEYQHATGVTSACGGLDRLRDVCQETKYDLFDDPVQTPLLWYLALKALELYYLKHGHYPVAGAGAGAGAANACSAADVDAVWEELSSLMKAIETEGEGELPVSREHIQEILRLGAHTSQLHTVSAMIGGLASQETIKLLTHQFIPMNNTFVFNGICGCGACYTF